MTDDETYFFVDMASSCRNGQCYLCGDIKSLKILSEQLHPPASNIYNALLSKYAESKSIMNIISKVFVITMNINLSFEHLPDVLKSTDKHDFILIDDAIDWKINEACCLLAENLEDCEFYNLIAQTQNSYGINIKFHYENGGGSTTSDVLYKCVAKEKVPTLCIIDSDQKYGATKSFFPPKGDTLKRVIDIGKKLKPENSSPPHCIFPLNVHEIENLIPISILQKLKDKYPNMESGLNLLIELTKIDNGTPILYYDMKTGFPFIKEDAQRAYWKEILIQLGGTIESDMPPNDKTADKSLFFPPLCNSSLLKQVNIFIKENCLNKKFQVDDYLTSYWTEIKEVILTWGCASNPMYA